MRETCRKFKITFDAAFEAVSVIFDITFQINETSFVALIINNAKVVIIIYFIAELRDVVIKSGYNFKIRYSSNLKEKENNISSNFECEVTFNNRVYFLKNVFKLKIKKMISFISI